MSAAPPASSPAAPPLPESDRRRPGYILALLVILAVAAGLRAYNLSPGRSLWVDEIYTYLSATGTQFRGYAATPRNEILPNPPPLTDFAHAKPWRATLRPDTDDIHPPLYFFLTRVWGNLVGYDAAHLRALAAIFSVLAVGLLYAAVSEWSGRGSGLAAAAIMAVAQPQVRMAQEARAYCMVLAMALAAAWAVARTERRGVNRRRVIALAVLCFAMPLTHYFSVAIAATLALYGVIRLRGQKRWAVLGATAGAAALFVLVWSPVLYLQAHGVSGRGTTVFVDAEANHFLATLARLALFPVRCLYEPLPNDRALSMVISGVCLLPLLMVRRRPDLLIWALWVPMNVAPALLNDLTHRSWTLEIERYTLPATLGVYALLGAVGASLPLRWRHLLPTLAVAGCLLHLDQAYHPDDRTSLQKWREFAAQYRDLARPGDLTVFASAGQPTDDAMYYLCVGHYARPFPGPVALLDQPPSSDLVAEIRRYPGVIVVGDARAAEAYLPAAHATGLHAIPFLGEVTRLEFGPPAAATTAPATPPPAAAGSTSRTAPTSRAIAAPRR